MRIHKTDGSTVDYLVTDIDSINFSETDTMPEDALDLIKWVDFLPWTYASQTPMNIEPVEVELTSGTVIKCDVYNYSCYLLGEGLYLGSDYGLHGAGYFSEVIMPLYIVNDNSFQGGTKNGAVVLFSKYAVYESPDSADIGVGLGGSLLDVQAYGAMIDQIFFKETATDEDDINSLIEAYQNGIQGAFVRYLDMNENTQTVDLGMLKEGTFTCTDLTGDGVKDFQYQIRVEWFDYYNGFGGLELDETGENIVKPYKLLLLEKTYSETHLLNKANAPAKKMPIQKQYKAVKPMQIPKFQMKQLQIKLK